MMMLPRTLVFLAFAITIGSANFFSFQSFTKIASYAKYLAIGNLTAGAAGNELWRGILKDCRGKMSFSCLQKNAYTYLDNTFAERDNITVFSGLILKRNNLDYGACRKNCKDDVNENIMDTGRRRRRRGRDEKNDAKASDPNENLYVEKMSPLEEITSALRDKTVKFLATRDYEVQLPEFFFESSSIKISPREIDENGALVRIDFGQRAVENHGRLFSKQIKKFINKPLLMSFLSLILIVKLIKVKFMFIIPFLFGVGTAKKIFLKLLLFLVPAFAHVFKLCSSYYSSHSKFHHHHHHQIAHHHHHVPVPVPIPAPSPAYFDHHPHHEEEFEGYDYAHPHIQLRKDMEELKEWGIDSFGEPYDNPSVRPAAPLPPPLPPASYAPSFAGPQFPPPVQSNMVSYQEKPINYPSHGQLMAYKGHLDDQKLQRRVSSQTQASPFPQVQLANSLYKQTPISVSSSILKSSAAPVNPVYVQPTSVTQTQRVTQQMAPKKSVSSLGQVNNQVLQDDIFYGPILQKLDDIFAQLRFVEESCRERLICSMYKNPSLYSPHSNLVSNELSRNPQELKRGGTAASQRFHRYVSAARFGQDGGDCLKAYACHINTE